MARSGDAMTADTLNEFVRLLIDLTGASTEQLLDADFQARCLAFVLTKNGLLEKYGTPPWPEDNVRSQVADYFSELRSAYTC
jgi:hypothetical protein